MRALSVPVPPAGLRRDVWRAIEAQQPARGAIGASAAPGPGKITSIARERERAQAPAAETRKGWNIGRLLPAAGLVAAMLVLFHFAVPFLLLLMRFVKKRAQILMGVSIGLIFMRLLDLFWLVEPARTAAFRISWLDVVMPIGLGGLWLSAFIWNLRRVPPAPAPFGG